MLYLRSKHDMEHLAKVRTFADERGLREQLEKRLKYLDEYAEHGDRGKTRCSLTPDGERSFYFVMQRRRPEGEEGYDFFFDGGCSFYESGDSGVGAPNFSVRIGQDLKAGWEINT